MTEQPHEPDIHTANIVPRKPRRKNLPTSGNTSAPHKNPILVVDSGLTRDAATQYIPTGWDVGVDDPSNLNPETYLGRPGVIVWGQNDDGGRAWAEDVADLVNVPCHVISLTSAPAHWHLADGLPEGKTVDQLGEFLTAALGKCEPRKPRASATVVAVATSNDIPEERGTPIDTSHNIPLDFIRTPRGGIEKLYANVVYLLRQYPGRWDLSYDDFADRAFLNNEPLRDSDLREIAEWVQHEGVKCGLSVIQEGIIRCAEKNTFHPVKKYLESLTWDGKPRLSRMLSVLGGAHVDADGLSDLLGRKWMIQAVARIYEPGCQADAMLVLEGEQGIGKSSLFRALFGDRWFTDHLPDLKDKDSMLQLRGVWCVEISELATLGRSDSAKIKQFLTSRVDRYRDPYGRLVSDWPRQSVFAGTINPGAEGYLKDPTGGRRFWPVPITNDINISGVTEHRDQLWAEAVAAYRAPEAWHFTDQELSTRVQVSDRQSERLEDDPWEPAVERYLASRDTTTTGDILRDALLITSASDWGRAEQMRVGRILTGMKWTRKKVRDGDKAVWRYYRGYLAQPAHEPELPVTEPIDD